MPLSLLHRFALASAAVSAILFSLPVQAQIAGDGTLGTQVNGNLIAPCTGVCLITNGTTRGSNLFHSFGRFNLNTGERANFASDATIRNIFSRVTGGTISSIDGLIFTNSANVNFYLINPAGIVFGPNARLDIGGVNRGSFVATTANAIEFGNQGQFSATNPNSPVPLLNINPSAYLFNQLPTGSIINRANGAGLRVPNGQTLTLLGGNVEIAGGRLNAWGGRVEIGAVGGVGRVEPLPNGAVSFAPDLPRGDVSLSNGAVVDVRLNNGGAVGVTARNLSLAEGSALRAGIVVGGTNASRAGDIRLDASGIITIEGASQIRNTVDSGATGNAGNVYVRANSFVIADRSSFITASNFSSGNAGHITIDAETLSINQGALLSRISEDGTGDSGGISINADTVSLAGSFITTANRGNGNGGDITFKVGSINATSGSQITSSVFGVGNSGNITVEARESINFSGSGLDNNPGLRTAIFTNVENDGNGKAGDIRLKADSISITNQAAVYSNIRQGGNGEGGNIYIDGNSLLVADGAEVNANVLGQGRAGNVIINAVNTVLNNGDIFTNVGPDAIKGNGGSINITGRTLYVTGGGQINAASNAEGDAGVTTIYVRDWMILDGSGNSTFGTGIFNTIENTETQGRSGNINITISAGSLLVQNGAQIQAFAAGSGPAGNITIQARDAVIFRGGRLIDKSLPELVFEPSAAFSSVSNQGTKGGNIVVQADSLVVDQGAKVDSTTNLGSQGDAGNIIITAKSSVTVDGVGKTGDSSQISAASGTLGFGAGGDIEIQTSNFRVSNGGIVTAQTDLFGVRGGNISIEANSFEAINGGQILAVSDGRGPAGTISITARDRVQISGTDPTYAARLAEGTIVDPVSANSGLYGRATSTGTAGNIVVNTPKLTVEQQGRINAESFSGNGGNITLNVPRLLLLRNGSQISTNAGTTQAGGDGGNITINAPKGFIVGVKGENSDISANAFTGSGGRVNITAQGLYGLQFRPRLTEFSDITASSTFGVSGVVAINTLGIDPSRGLQQLPVGLVDPSNRIDQKCAAGSGFRRSSFTVTGRGGLPENPLDPLQSGEGVASWVEVGTENTYPSTLTPLPDSSPPPPSTPSLLVEADRVMVGKNGSVQLVASQPMAEPGRFWYLPSCASLKESDR